LGEGGARGRKPFVEKKMRGKGLQGKRVAVGRRFFGGRKLGDGMIGVIWLEEGVGIDDKGDEGGMERGEGTSGWGMSV